MLLAIDIGNTTLSCVAIKGKKISIEHHINSHLPLNVFKKKFKLLLSSLTRSHGSFRNVSVCSVVPKLTKLVEEVVKKEWRIKASVIGRNIKVPIKSKYNPKQIGQDRLVGAYAAKKLYGFPLIIIDFGTATTFDIVSSKGVYEGGLIVPGIRLSTESLFSETALLPKIEKIKAPKGLIGKNTHDSILSGLFYGYGSMATGLIQLINRKMKGKAKIVITGGYTSQMKKYIKDKIHVIDNQLVYKGMTLLEKVN